MSATEKLVKLSGSHEQKLDDRNRLAIPTKLIPGLKELAGVTGDGPLDVVVTMTKNFRVGIYPRQDFMRIIEKLEQDSKTSDDAEELLTTYLNYMEQETLDKQNRVKIPQALSDALDLTGEVIVMGSGKFIEVVNKSTYKEQLKEQAGKMKQQGKKSKDQTPE
ncbi:hypothetical protein BH09SUM1_BH09SUM1_12090 [soil metagenome]